MCIGILQKHTLQLHWSRCWLDSHANMPWGHMAHEQPASACSLVAVTMITTSIYQIQPHIKVIKIYEMKSVDYFALKKYN
jgi:hypothetical protein